MTGAAERAGGEPSPEARSGGPGSRGDAQRDSARAGAEAASPDGAPRPTGYRLRELLEAAAAHYPDLLARGGIPSAQNALAFLRRALADADAAARDTGGPDRSGADPDPARFVRPTARPAARDADAWAFPNHRGPRALCALTYRGLFQVKTPFDLALYTRLIWELQPRTIIELGAFHGASALWFADQMTALVSDPGEVHSFELYTALISPAARHPLLRFHRADLRDLGTFDRALLAALPHPWLVVDDAHVDVLGVLRFFDAFLVRGDAYVIEDLAPGPSPEVSARAEAVEALGYLVDTHYTDAFGLNVTCAPNAWLRKLPGT